MFESVEIRNRRDYITELLSWVWLTVSINKETNLKTIRLGLVLIAHNDLNKIHRRFTLNLFWNGVGLNWQHSNLLDVIYVSDIWQFNIWLYFVCMKIKTCFGKSAMFFLHHFYNDSIIGFKSLQMFYLVIITWCYVPFYQGETDILPRRKSCFFQIMKISFDSSNIRNIFLLPFLISSRVQSYQW